MEDSRNGEGGEPASAATAAKQDAVAPVAQAPLSVLDAWISFGLNARRAQLDDEALQIAKRQDSSVESRKKLAGATKNFKKAKLPAAGQSDLPAASKAFTSLLKDYQNEIDALTARSKAGESAFLSLYKALYEVPDPVGDLKHSNDNRALVGQLREEVRVLREERSGLTERSAAAIQYESRIAELEAQKQAMAVRAAEDSSALLAAKQAEWSASHTKAMEAYEMREQELLHQISVANESLRSQQASVEALQLQKDEAVAKLESFRTARQSDSEMIAEGSERALAELNTLRRRCAMLEDRVTALTANEGDATALGDSTGAQASTSVAATRSAMSAEIASKDVEISQLKDQVAALEEVLSGHDKAKSTEFARLSDSIRAKDETIKQLSSRLDVLPSPEQYETMKRQFDTLQSFQLSEGTTATDDVSVVSSANGPEDGDADGSQPAADLERRLLGRLKALESRLASVRTEMSGKDDRIGELSSMVRSLEERNDDQKALIAQLEDGINAITADPSSARGMKARIAASSASLGDTTSNAPSGASTQAEGDASADDAPAGAWDWGEQQQAAGLQRIIREEPTMLDIVSGQRDRFRSRVLELEEESRRAHERLERLTADNDKMKGDNVRLYEKIRYLQSYAQVASENSSAASIQPQSVGSIAQRSGSVAIGMDDDDAGSGVLNQYRSMYEDIVNPYTLFNRRERHKRMSEMSAPERLTMRATQRAISTRTSRLLVFFYILALHVFVFFVLAFSTGRCPEVGVSANAVH